MRLFSIFVLGGCLLGSLGCPTNDDTDGGTSTTGGQGSSSSGGICSIGGTWNTGAVNPNNPCQICEPGASSNAWTNASDGTACGNGGACLGGVCGCAIGGQIVAPNSQGPSSCESCDLAASGSSWTVFSDGTPCGATGTCHSGACSEGCEIDGQFLANGAANPSNTCQICNVSRSSSAYVNAADGTSCGGSGAVCFAGTCESGCDIGGVLSAANAVDPSDPCEICNPSISATNWQSLPNGTACGNGEVCANGQCGSQCDIGGGLVLSGAINPANACETCQPGTSTTAWTDVANGEVCGTGLVCASGVCEAACDVDGVLLEVNALSPTNICQSCQPAASTTAFTNVANGTSCGGGVSCEDGTCTSGCVISGAFYATGAQNPMNACDVCAANGSSTSWTVLADGTACGNGQVCASGSCGSECDIAGALIASGTANPSNVCQSCQPGTSTSAWSNLLDGTACGSADLCVAGNCQSGCDIGNVVYASGSTLAGDVCKSCQPATSLSSWTNVQDGTSCGTGETCLAGNCALSGCTIGGSSYQNGASNPMNSCEVCDVETSQAAWSAVADGTTCSTGTCAAGACLCHPSYAKTTYSTGSDPVGIVAADFGTGHLSLATVNLFGSTVSVFVGHGDGTFATQATFATDSSPYGITAADISGDGIKDLIVTNQSSNDVSLLISNGDGTFQPASNKAVAAFPQGIATADFNNDGRADIVTANFNGNDVSVLLESGNLLGAATNYSTGGGSDAQGVTTGDFNGDGNQDVASVGYGNHSLNVLFGDGGGGLSGLTTDIGAGGNYPFQVVAEDFNGDGHTDLAVAYYGTGNAGVFLNSGTGTFPTEVDYAASSGSVALAAGDMNGDGKIDLLMPDFYDNKIFFLYGNGDGTFQAAVDVLTADSRPEGIVVGDFNGDGIEDFATSAYGTNKVDVFIGSCH